MPTPNAKSSAADLLRWRDAAQAWVERGPLAGLAGRATRERAQTLRELLVETREQEAMLRDSLAQLDRVGISESAERSQVCEKLADREARRMRIEGRVARIERLLRIADVEQPEDVRRWRMGCLARIDRAPVALADLKEVRWGIQGGPRELRDVVESYLDGLRTVGRAADLAVVHKQVRKALAVAADNTLESVSARDSLRTARQSLLPILLDGMQTEIEAIDQVTALRDRMLEGGNDTLRAGDAPWVPRRLWVVLALAGDADDALRAEVERRVAAWPAWLPPVTARDE